MDRKRTGPFIVTMALFGVLTGLGTVVVLMAIAVPSVSPYLLTLTEKADVERMAWYAGLLGGSGLVIFLLVLIATGILTLAMLLGVINPSCMNGVRNWRTIAGVKLAVAVVAALAWVFVVTAAVSGSSATGAVQSAVQAAVIVAATALLWSVAGGTGWAGELSPSSWALPSRGMMKQSVVRGAAAGMVLFVLLFILERSQANYFLLVSEVLDRSGETSFLGFQYLAAGLVVMLGAVFTLFGAFAAALAPVHRDAGEVRRMLVVPTAAFVLFSAVLLAAYGYAGRTYDLDKKDLASLLGIPAAATTGRTLIILHPSTDRPISVQDWPLQASGAGFGGITSTMALSEENLGKVEAYLAVHADGSVFTYVAREILYKGSLALWDVKKGLARQVDAASSQLLPRMQLLARLRVLPVTDEHVRLLESFSDEATWSVGGRSALALARGYQHYGRTADARRWLARAQAAKAEGAADDLLAGPVVTDGTVRGRVLVNGSAPRNARVALVSVPAQQDGASAFTISDFVLGSALVDAKDLFPDGRFSFDHLGSGIYRIAIAVDRELIPPDARPGALTVRAMPGLLRIGPERVRDIGTIDITYTK